MNWQTFTIGFWHPFGDHGAHPDGRIETADEILQRKAREIGDNRGWTLWSFQYRSDLDHMLRIIEAAKPTHVYALCSQSRSTKAPSGRVERCRQYRLVGATEWLDIPREITIPHPIGERKNACAFMVKGISVLTPQDRDPAGYVQWYSTRTECWSDEYPTRHNPHKRGYPPRPETLIRRMEGGAPLRPVRAVLELARPFLATLRV